MVIYGHDLTQFYYWIKHFVWAIEQRSLDYLLWSPWSFLGHPYLFNLEYGALYPLILLSLVIGVGNYINVVYAFSIFVSIWGMKIFVEKVLGLPRWCAWLAGLVWGLNGFVFPRIWAGHFNMIATYPWLPWELSFISRYIDSGKKIYGWGWIASIYFQLTAGFASLFLFSGFIQIVWALYWSWGKWRLLLKNWKSSFLILVIALILSTPILVSFKEILNNSQRSVKSDFNFSSSFSLPINQTITAFLPDYLGNPIYKTQAVYNWNYRGEYNYWELSFFIGAGTVFLIILSLFNKNKRIVLIWWFLGFGSLILVLGENTPIFGWWFKIIPLYSYIRIPAHHLYLVVFTGAILASYGANYLNNLNRIKKNILVALFILTSMGSVISLSSSRLLAWGAENARSIWASDFGDSYVLINKTLEGISDPVVTRKKGIELISNKGWNRQTTGLVLNTLGQSELIYQIEQPNLSLNTLIITVNFANEKQILDVSLSDDGVNWNKFDSITSLNIKRTSLDNIVGDWSKRTFVKTSFVKISAIENTGPLIIDRMLIAQF